VCPSRVTALLQSLHLLLNPAVPIKFSNLLEYRHLRDYAAAFYAPKSKEGNSLWKLPLLL